MMLMSPHVALRCDGRPELGVGHVTRCLALGDELVSRGVSVTLVGDVDRVPWVQDQLAIRVARDDLAVVACPKDTEALVALSREHGFDAMVLDGYHLDPRSGRALRSAGRVVLAVVDGAFGAEQEADLYLDQNLGAQTPTGPWVPADAVHLLGLDHVLFRDQILRHRRLAPPETASPPRVLCVFGGTDACAAGPVMVPLLVATGRPVHVVAVAARPELARILTETPVARGQRVEVVAPTPDLAELAAGCDAAVIAAGSSMWEFLYLGVPTAIVCVTDNQRLGYDAVARRAVSVTVGHLAALRGDPGEGERAVARLTELLDDSSMRDRLTAAGQSLVDGRGRVRVVDALLRVLALPR